MMKPGEVLSKLNELVYSILLVGYKKCKENEHYSWEQSFHSLWFITKGKGELYIDGTSYPAEAGKIFFLKPNMNCERVSDTDDSLEYYFVRFTYASAYLYKEQWTFASEIESEFPLLGMYNLQNPPQVMNLLEQIYELKKHRGSIVMMKKKLLFTELLLTIIQDFKAQKITGDTTNSIDSTVDFLSSHYQEKITLNYLSQLAGMSESHYSRLFKKIIGYSPMDYLRHVRMDRAKELIVLSDFRLKAIAQSVGYHDEFYFSRTFKKVVGVSPTEFAKRHRTKRKLPEKN
ncbi:AraC family transcriptional regulator [Evansella sp. AB-rgal1]|uniref:AraC family transcriptional regulator n=1 Tax=Evansella sp. AB-rgal1 TaxID=3242696 RepID=UPI00359D9FD3